jgi:hypothetical protein
VSAGGISFLIETFEYAVGLARGEPDIDKREQAVVKGLDMLVAHAYAEQIDRIFKKILWKFYMMQWSPFSREDARQFVARSADAATRFEVETRVLSPLNEQQGKGTVPSLKGGWPAIWVRTMRASRETLEVVVGERTIQQSFYQAMNDQRAEFFWTTMPVVGECILIYEAALGKEAATGRKLSNEERAIDGLAVILPHIIEYAGKQIAAGLKITRRAVTLALDDLKIYSITKSIERIPRSINLALGLRILPDQYFNEFVDLLHTVKVAQELNLLKFLTNKQISRLNFFVSRMRDSARAAAWLNIVGKELGSATRGGYVKMKFGVKVKPREEKGLMLLAEQSGDMVVHLPETNPGVYPKTSALQGEAHPDAVWRGELVDIYCPQKGTSDNVIADMITRKQEQAPTIVVALLDDGAFQKDDIASIVYRKIWPNPEATGVSRVVIVDKSGIRIVGRPNIFTPPMMAGIVRMGIGDAKRLAEIYSELEREPQ